MPHCRRSALSIPTCCGDAYIQPYTSQLELIHLDLPCRASSSDMDALPKTHKRSWMCRRANRLVHLPVRALALARAVPHCLASRAHAARLLRRASRRRTPRKSNALGLERQLLPILQRNGIPAGACVERHHARALAVVLGLGDEPLHEHASAGGQRTRRAGGGRCGCVGLTSACSRCRRYRGPGASLSCQCGA